MTTEQSVGQQLADAQEETLLEVLEGIDNDKEASLLNRYERYRIQAKIMARTLDAYLDQLEATRVEIGEWKLLLESTEYKLAAERKARDEEKVRLFAAFEEQYKTLDNELRPKLKEANNALNCERAARKEAELWRQSETARPNAAGQDSK